MSDSGIYRGSGLAGQLTYNFCDRRLTGNTHVWRHIRIQYHGFRIGHTSGKTTGAALTLGQCLLNYMD
ncbi:MAG: hypothetical protein A4E52_02305 [Pelotomaculum sp. PtaB.Bin013]|nr:MAG: hypothetical protein A4E52_02305 [Pelotomaculum sp. PtaB.Bin013]